RQRQQEQQHQRGPHAGQLPPGVTQPGHRPGDGHTLTSVASTKVSSQVVNSPQAPVSSATPTAASSPAPIRVTHRGCRRTTATTSVTHRKPSPNATNGSPNPRVYAAANTAARPGCPPTPPSASTAPMVGPMQGVQDRANTAPNTGALATPAAGSRWSRSSRVRPGSSPSRAAANASSSTP